MCSSYVYKSIPYLHGIVAIIELVLGIIRLLIFFSPKTSHSPTSLFGHGQAINGSYINSPLLFNKQARAALAFDAFGSIVPIFMGIYIAIFLVVVLISICCACDCIYKTFKNQENNTDNFHKAIRLPCALCLSKPNHRFVSLTCNFPCYRARPRLRFVVRFIITTSFFIFRLIAIILYATAQDVNFYGAEMAILCTIAIFFFSCTIFFDIYQYRVWWHYRPDGVYEKCRFLCCQQKFHKSHERFLPMPLLGKFRDQSIIGDRPCTNTASGSCPDRSLDHIVSFHAFDFKPLKRYRPGIDNTYIGFHQTTQEAAVGISKEGFRRSEKPPQMLGFGVYFARSFADTEGKARAKGAFIVAEVNMGKVRMIERNQIGEVSDSKAWWNEYDTIYLQHTNEEKDEFCIKDPAQIIKWVIVMDDSRLYRYGLDQEYSNTLCGWI